MPLTFETREVASTPIASMPSWPLFFGQEKSSRSRIRRYDIRNIAVIRPLPHKPLDDQGRSYRWDGQSAFIFRYACRPHHREHAERRGPEGQHGRGTPVINLNNVYDIDLAFISGHEGVPRRSGSSCAKTWRLRVGCVINARYIATF